VPLIVHYLPRFEPGREARPVANYDLFPTLLELAGVDAPAGLDTRAVSLLEPLEERSRLAEDPSPSSVAIATVRASHPDWDPTPWKRRLRALIEGRQKLIWGSDGRHELYDLATDPGESQNLFERQPEDASRRLGALDELYASLQVCEIGAPPPEFSPEQVERLRALGYVGN
jgi:arylsulfatase A-like enzyme